LTGQLLSDTLVNASLAGVEWFVDAAGCRPEALRDPHALRRLCDDLIAQLGLHVIGDGIWHQFPAPGGVTGLFLLTESHLACHTYPETGVATFNLYCCRSRPDWPWEQRLRERLGAKQVTVRRVWRGVAAGEGKDGPP
jgi:S-adenosylmethionine decarboxylase